MTLPYALAGVAAVLAGLAGMLAALARWARHYRAVTPAPAAPAHEPPRVHVDRVLALTDAERDLAVRTAAYRAAFDHVEKALAWRLTMLLERAMRAANLRPDERTWAHLGTGEFLPVAVAA